jgi:acyl-CoA reductase-like NAD-dependent aldehyde dehydrogenase
MTTTQKQRLPAAAEAIPVENPGTGGIVAHVPDLSAAEVAALVERGRAAQPAWAALGPRGRVAYFDRCRRWLVKHREEAIDTLVSETGKVYEDAALEVMYVAALLAFWAKKAPKWLHDESTWRPTSVFTVGRTSVVRRVPLGVVGVIGPWNFPLVNSFSDCIAPLAAGNVVVLKPSEVTPLASLLMERMTQECGLPDGVFKVATGRGETGGALVDEADAIMFTGSLRTGRLIAARAGKQMKPFCLELGGKDPMIVLADADLERAANSCVYWGLVNAGQLCLSVERIYVEERAYDRFVELVEERVRGLRQGWSQEPGVSDLGAIIFPPQLEIIERHVADAVAKGARLVVGGHTLPGPGRYFEPTVLADVDHTMECMREETFGPTLPIMKVKDAAEAIALANDSAYGLGASIWSGDRKRAERLAREILSGGVCVNDHNVNNFAFDLPQAGWKDSGFGGRHSPDGIKKWTRPQTIMTTRMGMTKELYHYPNTAKTGKLMQRATRLLYGRR